MESVLITTLDILESVGFISAICIFFVGLGLSLYSYNSKVLLAGVSLSTALCIAPFFIRLFVGIDAPTDPVQVNAGYVAVIDQMPVDEYAIEDGNQEHSEEEFISIKALVIVGAIPFVIGFLFVIAERFNAFSVFSRTNNNERETTNQAEQGDERLSVLEEPTSDQASLAHTSQSVGSLKSTRKIQLD